MAYNKPNSKRRQLIRQISSMAALGLLTGASKAAPAVTSTAQPALPTGLGRLKGKTAVVTGAARGIGRAIAVAFAREGVTTVMGIDLADVASPAVKYPASTMADLTETSRLVQAEGGRFIPVKADIRDLKALQAAAKQAGQAMDHVDILVANAGIQVFAPFLEMTDAQWNDNIDINLTGTVNTVRAFAPMMADRKQGRIILTASGQGKKGLRNGTSYAASKWGTIGFMKSLAMDLGKYQITVNALVPGLIDTPMTQNVTRWTEAYQDYESRPSMGPVTKTEAAQVRQAHSPLGVPWLSPDEMAPMVVFLASDEAHLITGASFDVNGGDSASFTA